MRRIRESGLGREENYSIQMKRRMQHCTRSLIHLIGDMDFILKGRERVIVGSLYSVGLVERIIIGEIVHRMRVEDHRFIMLRRHK